MPLPKNKMHRILFIDDSFAEHFYVESIIEIDELAIIPDFKDNIVNLFEHLHQLDNDKFPHAIVVDINMPLMNGFDFTNTFMESLAIKHPDTAIFILGGAPSRNDAKQAKQFDIIKGLLVKPFSKEMYEQGILPFLPQL